MTVGHAFWDLISLQTNLRDPRPVTRAYQRAVHDAEGGAALFPGFVRRILSDRTLRRWRFEPAARRALIAAAETMEAAYEDARYGGPALYTIDAARRDFVGLCHPAPPEREARIKAFREIVKACDRRGDPIDVHDALMLCERLAREEQAGTWSATTWIENGTPF